MSHHLRKSYISHISYSKFCHVWTICISLFAALSTSLTIYIFQKNSISVNVCTAAIMSMIPCLFMRTKSIFCLCCSLKPMYSYFYKLRRKFDYKCVILHLWPCKNPNAITRTVNKISNYANKLNLRIWFWSYVYKVLLR